LTEEMLNIRTATDEDAPILPDIERASGTIFRQWPGLEWIADDAVQTKDEHLALIANGLALVAEMPGSGIVAFLNGEMTPDTLHIRQVAVHPDWHGRGIGRRLIETAQEIAKGRGANVLTLTTFKTVPWNEPYYARLGLVTLTSDELDTRLRDVWTSEERAGLPMALRCAMKKPL